MFFNAAPSVDPSSFAEILVALIGSGFGQSVVIILVLCVIFYLGFRYFKSSNDFTISLLDRVSKTTSEKGSTKAVQDRLEELESADVKNRERLRELEKLPEEVQHLAGVIDEVRQIVDGQ